MVLLVLQFFVHVPTCTAEDVEGGHRVLVLHRVSHVTATAARFRWGKVEGKAAKDLVRPEKAQVLKEGL